MVALVFFGLDWPRLPGARGARELCSAMGSRLVPALLGAFLLMYARLCCSEGPTTTTLLVRELSDDGKLLSTCSRAQYARVTVPVKPCTASPCLPLFVAQACWGLTNKLRPPGASLSSQYRSVSDLKKAETCLRSATALVSQSTPTDDLACGKGPQQSPSPTKVIRHPQWPPYVLQSHADGQSTWLPHDYAVCSMAVSLLPARLRGHLEPRFDCHLSKRTSRVRD